MSYRVGTPHYKLPQTEGSDTRDWFDTNEAFADIDAAIYSAGQTAESAKTDLTEVKNDVQGLKDADIAMTGRVDGIDGRLSANELKIQRLENATADNKQDLMDAICSIEEASATAAYPHNTGEFFWYNDTLYKATANIAIGQQIVPDTNCKTTNITTELLAGGQGGVEIDDTVISASKVWSSYKTNEEITNASAPKTGDTRYNSGKLQYYDGSAWVDVEIGGTMPTLDYTNPIGYLDGNSGHTSFTATKDCYAMGALASSGANVLARVKINGNVVCASEHRYSSDSIYANIFSTLPLVKLSAGDVISLDGTVVNTYIGIYEEKVN